MEIYAIYETLMGRCTKGWLFKLRIAERCDTNSVQGSNPLPQLW